MKKHPRKLVAILVMVMIAVAFCISFSTSRPTFAASNQTSDGVETATLLNVATLTDPPALGNGINLAGFSALTHLPGDPQNVFYTVTDRGPNGTVTVNGVDQIAFPIPTFTPTIIKFEVVGTTIKIVKQIPLKLAWGKDPITGTRLVSGVSNLAGPDEAPYDSTGNPLPYDPYGLDTEGLAYSPLTHTFWLSEEYRPSLLSVTLDGTILFRLVPHGEAAAYKDARNIPVLDFLPADFGKRVQNKGLESVTVTPNGCYLYTALQAPEANPDATSTTGARVIRIAQIDLFTLRTKEFAYFTPDAKQFPKLTQDKIFISDMFALDDNTVLVDERDSKTNLKSIVRIDVRNATNILGHDTFAGKTLEQMSVDELQQAGIVYPTETVILDLLKFGYHFAKVEGLAVVGDRLSVVNDNDFDIGGTDATQIWTFELPKSAFHEAQ